MKWCSLKLEIRDLDQVLISTWITAPSQTKYGCIDLSIDIIYDIGSLFKHKNNARKKQQIYVCIDLIYRKLTLC